MNLLRNFLVGAVFLFSGATFAMEEGQFSLGVLGGQVGLTGDVADVDQNGGLGLGFLAGYSVRDDLFFNFQYHTASLGKVDHSALTAGTDFYLMGPDAARPYLSAGLGLLNNTIDFGVDNFQPVEPSAQAFGLYLGGGFEFEITPAVGFGIQARYNFVFDAQQTVAGEETQIVQDTYSVLARAIFTFGSSRPW